MLRALILLLVLSLSWAAYDVTSNAFDLDISTNILVLSGDVLMGTTGYVFSAPISRIDIDNQCIFISESFKIKNKVQTIKGTCLEIDNKASVLTANELNMSFQKYKVSGRNVRAGSSSIRMNKVFITSCKGTPPVILLDSDEVVLYPQWGFLVAFNSILNVKGIPIFYFPAYFMGDRRQDLFAQNHLIPEFGSSPREGGFVKEDVPYYINESNHGAVRIAYIEALGMQIGATHYMMFQDGQSHASVAAYYSPKRWQGHVSYRTALFNDFQREQDALGYLFNSGIVSIRQSNAYLTVGWHESELINNQYVTQKPRIALETVLGITDQDNINVSVEQSNVCENQLTDNQKTAWTASWQSAYPTGWGVLSQQLSWVSNVYGSTFHHQRLAQNWALTLPFEGWSVATDYEHLYAYSGESPFLFDQYQVDPYDKIGLALKIELGLFDLETKWRRRVGQDYDYSRRFQLSLPYEKCLEFSVFWEDVDKVMGVEVRL